MRQPNSLAVQAAIIKRELAQLAADVDELLSSMNLAPAAGKTTDARAESMKKRWAKARKLGLTVLPPSDAKAAASPRQKAPRKQK